MFLHTMLVKIPVKASDSRHSAAFVGLRSGVQRLIAFYSNQPKTLELRFFF
jgi:hypothetical protein